MSSAPAFPAMTTVVTGLEIHAALAQLDRSERGHAVAVNFRKFLKADDGIAYSLDRDNWRALVVLMRAAAQGRAVVLTDVLPRR